MANLSVVRCTVKTFSSCPFPMIVAVIKDLNSNKKYEVSEWINTVTNTVEREDSFILDNYKYTMAHIAANELFNILDQQLRDLRSRENENCTQCSNRLAQSVRNCVSMCAFWRRSL